MEKLDAVLQILRAALWGQEAYPLMLEPNLDLNGVYKELVDQTVDGISVDVLGTRGFLEESVRKAYMMQVAKRISVWHRLMKEQEELRQLFGEANVPFAIIKGAAADMYYPKPEYRAMGDIDVVVTPEAYMCAVQTLQDHGFALEDGDQRRHANLKRNGVEVELHHCFATMNDVAAAAKLDDLIFEGVKEPCEGRIGEFVFPMLPKLANGLVLLAHIDHHMEYGIGLRQIIDWMLFVDCELDDTWWQQEFGEWTRKLGLEKEAMVITRMCQQYLGLREDGISWCRKVDDELCRKMLLWTLDRGNFGRKMTEDHDAVRVLNEIPKLKDIPKQLQAYGRINWKLIQKYPFLKAFAWLYQLCRYVRLALSRKKPIRQFVEDVKVSRGESAFLDCLEVGRRRKDNNPVL